MRTDTASFAKNAFKAVRSLGVNSVRSKHLARQIVQVANHGGYDAQGGEIPGHTSFDAFRVALEFAFSGFQYVQIWDGDQPVFTVTTAGGRIVSTEATPAQIALRERMEIAGRAIYASSGELCAEWEKTHGYPQTREAADLRHDFVEADPRHLAARAAYDALRDESLALNPFAPANVIDWKQWGHFSDWYKEETGSRPGTHWRHAEMVRWLERQTEDQDMALAA